MQTDDQRRDGKLDGFVFVGVMLALMWIVEVVDVAAGHRLDQYGIEPRDADGLIGIATAPFLHDGFGHLIGNTVPFAVLGLMIAVGGLVRVALVSAVVAVIGGLGTWLVAPGNSIHLGASGLVFGFATYLITRGVFSRNFVHIGIGIVVVLLWGGALLGGLVPQDGISWQGHLFGGIGGIVAARLVHGRREEVTDGPPVPSIAHV